jgi:Putative addiction module component
MKITLNFPDNKAAFILELLRNLKFVSIEKTEDIPQWHKDILDERIAEYEKNPNDLIDWEDIQKEKVKAVI